MERKTENQRSLAIHLPIGTEEETPIIKRAMEILKEEGYAIKVVGQFAEGNMASNRAIAVLPGGTQIHGLGDLRSRINQAFEREREAAQAEEAAMKGDRKPVPAYA